MRNLQKYKISNPNDRFDRISKLLNNIGSNEIFDEWGLKVAPNMTQIKGKKLHPAEVLDSKNNALGFDAYTQGKIPHT